MKPTRLVASLILAVTAPSVTGAASPTVQPAHAATSYTYYTVEGGDTLTRIAKLYGVTVASIQQLNGMGTSTRITVGQKLKVRATSSTPWRPNLRYAQPVTSLQPAKPIAVTTNWTGVKAPWCSESSAWARASRFSTPPPATRWSPSKRPSA